MASVFHMYGEIVYRGSTFVKGTVSQSFTSTVANAHLTANEILRNQAISNNLDLLQLDFVVKSLTRLGEHDER